jgi:hypothetical protein
VTDVGQTNHWKLGLFVVTGLGIALATVFWLGLRRLNRDALPAVTYFDESVQGLDVNSPVKFRGVTLGTVSTITVAPDQRHVGLDALYRGLNKMGFDPNARAIRCCGPSSRRRASPASSSSSSTSSAARYPPPGCSSPCGRYYVRPCRRR